ncbi:MAG: ABC transporter permease [Variibacter sp.]
MRLAILIPLAWLVLFVFAPTIIAFKISLSQTVLARPPYAPVLDLSAGFAALTDFLGALSFDNYATVFGDRLYIASYLKSLQIAAISTALLLVIGYPIAYAMARAPRGAQRLLLVLVILPFWTAFLIRIYAWINILQRDGLLNQLLQSLGIVDAPVAWLASDTAVYIGIVYSYLPFMVLPLYASLERMDETLREAAADLGCPPWKIFWQITVPLSRPGILAGVLLCFIPIVGEFVIPDLLGSSSTLMIGQTLWTEFFANRDWPVASVVALLMLALLVGPIVLYEHLQARALEKGR